MKYYQSWKIKVFTYGRCIMEWIQILKNIKTKLNPYYDYIIYYRRWSKTLKNCGDAHRKTNKLHTVCFPGIEMRIMRTIKLKSSRDSSIELPNNYLQNSSSESSNSIADLTIIKPEISNQRYIRNGYRNGNPWIYYK